MCVCVCAPPDDLEVLNLPYPEAFKGHVELEDNKLIQRVSYSGIINGLKLLS